MNSGPTLSMGLTGPDVRRLRFFSDENGLFRRQLWPKTQVINHFNRETISADGVIGPLT
jgi:hypothetical protein